MELGCRPQADLVLHCRNLRSVTLGTDTNRIKSVLSDNALIGDTGGPNCQSGGTPEVGSRLGQFGPSVEVIC